MIQEHSKFFFICGKSKMQLWKDKVELDSLKSKCKKTLCFVFRSSNFAEIGGPNVSS